MGNLKLNDKKKASRYFGIGARESALFMDHELMILEQKERFGRSYERATNWYALLNKKSVKSFTSDDYRICYYQWQVLNALGDMVGIVELEDGSNVNRLQLEERYIEDTFMVMKSIFGGSEATTSEDKIEFIQSCLKKFERDAKTETLHKASLRIIKMSFEDIQDTGTGYVFDSRKCGQGGMRVILTSEDGISRLLSEMGKEQIVINLNTSHLEETKELEEEFRKAKEELFLNGITDSATGKHYMVSAPSASSTRHVDFPFVRADKPEEVYDIWCQITGFTSLIELMKNIGHQNEDGSIEFVPAKTKARIAQNGANSLSTGKTASERVRNELLKATVVFVSDCKGTIYTPYKKITSIGVLGMEFPDGSSIEERVE